MYFKFGVDSFIWTEDFKEKDLWIISKAKEMGFEVIDFAIANPFTFPTEAVKAELEKVGIDCVWHHNPDRRDKPDLPRSRDPESFCKGYEEVY